MCTIYFIDIYTTTLHKRRVVKIIGTHFCRWVLVARGKNIFLLYILKVSGVNTFSHSFFDWTPAKTISSFLLLRICVTNENGTNFWQTFSPFFNKFVFQKSLIFLGKKYSFIARGMDSDYYMSEGS